MLTGGNKLYDELMFTPEINNKRQKKQQKNNMVITLRSKPIQWKSRQT